MSKKRVFVVDDQWKAAEEKLSSVLLPDSFTVEYAKNADEFINAPLEKYDAVILDINLDLWELSLVKAFKIIGAKSPVILFSSKMYGEGTNSSLMNAIDSQPEVSVIQTIDMRLLEGDKASPETTSDEEVLSKEKESKAKIWSTLIKIAIETHDRKKPFVVEDNQDIHILHISDTQYGDPDTDEWSSYLEEEMAAFLEDKFKAINFVILSGDVAYSGKKEEYELAKNGLERLAIGLWNKFGKSEKERFIICPGNHDVSFGLSAVSYLSTSFSSNGVVPKLIEKIDSIEVPNTYGMTPFRLFAFEFTGDSKWVSQEELNWVDDNFSYLGLRFILLNSAGNIDCVNPKKAAIPISETNRLKSESFSRKDDIKYTIAVSHHGPKDPEYPDKVEELEDWPRISNWLRNSKVNLWTHGHGHRRIAMTHPYGQNGSDSEILSSSNTQNEDLFVDKNEFIRTMAPTTHLNGKLREGGRGFSVIKLQRRRRSVESVSIKSYEFSGGVSVEKVAEVKFKYEG